MSYIRINITDKNQTVNGEVHGATGEHVVAALSAEPETIDELALALARFEKPRDEVSPFLRFARCENLEPYDAGILVIDLAGRTIACASTYLFASKKGAVFYHNGEHATDFPIRYQLPDDWKIVHSTPEYEGVAGRRREERNKIAPFDKREILYGRPLLEFIAAEISASQKFDDEDLFADIHAKWLMTARNDLGGKTPREILFEKRDFIESDLSSREHQWSFSDECPPPLLPNSHAYRFAGIGVHEWVIYYDLMRFLLGECVENRAGDLAERLERLENLKNEWFETPQYDYLTRTPADVIDCERKRLPFVMSPEYALIDEDCPMCQMMAQDTETPMFWHLDGSAMEYDRFEFSYCETREEWDEEQRQYEEFSRNYRAEEGKENFETDELFLSDEETIQ